MLQDAPSSIKLARGHLNSFIAVKSGYPFAIDDGIKISLPEIITYTHTYNAYIGSSIIQLQDGWVTFGGPTFSTKQEGRRNRLSFDAMLLATDAGHTSHGIFLAHMYFIFVSFRVFIGHT